LKQRSLLSGIDARRFSGGQDIQMREGEASHFTIDTSPFLFLLMMTE